MLKSHEKFHSANGKRQILVADDELINRELLGMVLQSEYEVLYAVDGQETLDKIRENAQTLSLVLMDLKMPVMGGLDVLRIMKEEPELSRIPVIVLTSDQDAEIESLSLGAIDFIPKPYPQAGVMLARILRTIELSEDRQIINSTERDPLTGLYNREFFYRYAEQFDRHHRNMEMDAIVVDVNHFHMINERFGAAYGDDVLRRIGGKMREMVQGTGGIVCRREADTFMIYCPHGKNYQEILESASLGLAGDDTVNNRIRLRMGIYENADKTLDIERRFDRAKLAADTVKGSFTKTIGIYDNAMHEKELYSERLIEDFYTAIREKQFQVFYQPKFDIRPEIPVLASAEALVRWFHPALGMISPGVFIPLFEENGLIQTLDHYVWEDAAAQVRDWKERFGFVVPVSVNVSRIDMYDPRLVEIFREILEKNGLTPGEFLLEITESAYTQDSEQIIETVNHLRNLGFRIEMDDFGTGYSSLNMISTLPIDALKLDMQFIRNAFNKHRDTRMLEVIIDIADYLGVPVIAEGVETEDQLLALKAMGCDLVQGYYFSRPVPAPEYEHFILDRKERGDVPAAKDRTVRTRTPERQDIALGRITHALSSGYESIYYVDTVDGRYVEFSSRGKYEDLQIERSGEDFFAEMVNNVRKVIYEGDQERVLLSMQKETLLAQMPGRQPFSMTYRILIDGEPVYYFLKAVRAAAPDNHHLVIGVCNIDEQITEEERMEAERQSKVTFSSIAEALSLDYFSIYYVDVQTDHFIEYSADDKYKALGIERTGEDFFGCSRKNVQRLVHPDDRQMFLEAFTRERVLKELEQNRTFTLTYRLLLDGHPTYVHLKATRMENRGSRHLVIGISNVDEQMRREQEHLRAVWEVNRDALTGVKSKHAYKAVEKETDEAIAAGSAEPFAVAVCDLNGLKQINDTYGHTAGDKYIKDACMIICRIFKHSPVFRVGGDEFAVFLRGGDYADRARLLQLLEDKNEENRKKGDVTIAAGIAVYNAEKDSSLSSVFERADAAMYEDKKRLKEG